MLCCNIYIYFILNCVIFKHSWILWTVSLASLGCFQCLHLDQEKDFRHHFLPAPFITSSPSLLSPILLEHPYSLSVLSSLLFPFHLPDLHIKTVSPPLSSVCVCVNIFIFFLPFLLFVAHHIYFNSLLPFFSPVITLNKYSVSSPHMLAMVLQQHMVGISCHLHADTRKGIGWIHLA